MDYHDLIEQLAWEFRHSIEEADKKNRLSNLKAKQKSITSLFPTFDERVGAVERNGGVYFIQPDEPGVWKFNIRSGTDKSKSYPAYLYWDGIEDRIREHAKDRRLWNKDKTKIDLNLLAREILTSTDLKLKCSCPADLFFGGQFLRTKRDAKYTEPENRPPVKKNPKQYGLVCKHLASLLNRLPFYANDLAKHIRIYFKDVLDEIEGTTKKEVSKVKQTAEVLKKLEKEKETPKETPEETPEETPKETEDKNLRFRRGSV